MNTEKINNFLNDWLISNQFTDLECLFDTDFSFDYVNNIIRWSLLIPQAHDDLFLDFCFENGLNFSCDNFILSFFHELGHAQTIDILDESEINNSCVIINEIQKKTEYSLKDYYNYYNTPLEKEATLWAINFINENPKAVSDFWFKVKNLILEIYGNLGA